MAEIQPEKATEFELVKKNIALINQMVNFFEDCWGCFYTMHKEKIVGKMEPQNFILVNRYFEKLRFILCQANREACRIYEIHFKLKKVAVKPASNRKQAEMKIQAEKKQLEEGKKNHFIFRSNADKKANIQKLIKNSLNKMEFLIYHKNNQDTDHHAYEYV